jgi:folate-binding protein YgfZ
MAETTPLHDRESRAGAVFVEEAGWLVPGHFGDMAAEYAQARTGAVLFDRSNRGKVEVSGADTARFLHNLSTNDVLNLAPGSGCEVFLATLKARVVAYFLLFHLPRAGTPDFWLDTASGTAAKVIAHLDHYLISEQVEFADRTQEFAQLHLAGPQAVDVLGRAIGPIPKLHPLQVIEHPCGNATCQVRRQDVLRLPGFDVLCSREQAGEIWDRLVQAGARPAGSQAYEVLRIEAGQPEQGADVDENTFAPEVGRTAQAICYTKGCYLGQEPIVMARDRGQVNRTLLGVKLPGGPVPSGSLIFRDGKEVGRVTSSAVSPRLGAIGLAYVRRGNQEPGTAVEVEASGQRQPAQVVGLPFTD